MGIEEGIFWDEHWVLYGNQFDNKFHILKKWSLYQHVDTLLSDLAKRGNTHTHTHMHKYTCSYLEKFTRCMHLLKFFLNVYLFLIQRATEHEQGRGRERGKHRIPSRPQAPNCHQRARSGSWTHGPWDHDLGRSRVPNRLSHPGAPRNILFRMAGIWMNRNTS